MKVQGMIRSIAQVSLIAGLGALLLPACSSLEVPADGPEFSGPSSQDASKDEEDDSEQVSEKESAESEEESPTVESKEPEADPTSEGEEETGEVPKERSCDDIEWGDELEEGETVMLGATKGYLDSDGDDKVEAQETDVGMCQLHQTGKKCGMVFYARRT